MAKRLLLRDAENFSQDQIQRVLGALLWSVPLVPGVGTGYSAGMVGRALTTSTGHLAVTANGSTMVLTMLPGWAHVIRDAGGTTYDPRLLFAESDANDTATVTANSTGSTRNDTVCLRIDMNSAPTSDGSNLVSFVIIAGQSGGGLSNAPADGNLYLPLANVAVANLATLIAQGNVTDKRVSALNLSDLRCSKQSPAFVGSYTPDPTQGEIVAMTLTGAITVNAPAASVVGQKLRFYWTQDATGGRVVTYNAVYRTGGAAAFATTLSTVTIDDFECIDSVNWRLVSRITGQAI